MVLTNDLSPHWFNIVNLVTPTHGSDNDLSPHWVNIVNLVTPTHGSDNDLTQNWFSIAHQPMVLTMIFLRTRSIL